ncbi:MAG: cation:proton antiporter [Anaeromyxobacter sp.]
MHELDILLTFAGGLTGALVLGFVAHRLKLSPIVGYLLAGVLVGPFTPGYVADRAVADQFAEIGVILLLFGVGLRFHLRELIAVWRVAVPGALIQSTVSTLLLAALLRPFGWSWASGLVLGMGISVASTVVMALVLAERHDLHAPIGHIAIGWTVVEDLLTVVLLLVLPILFGPDQGEGQGTAAVLGLAGLKLLGLVAAVVVLGRWAIPWALERIERTRVRELFTLAVLVLAVGIAVGSAKVFGVSMALGAFLAGLAVGRSEFAARAAGDAVPMRDAFAVLFFVSVGMLFDPRSILEVPLLVLVVLAVVLVGKPLAALAAVRLLGVPLATAAPVGAAFSQVGEFSFILGTVARQLGLLGDAGWNALVASSIISNLAQPRPLPVGAPDLVPDASARAGRACRPARGRPAALHPGRPWPGGTDRPPPAHRPRRRGHPGRSQPRHHPPGQGRRADHRVRRRAPAGDARGRRHRQRREPGPERGSRGRRRGHPAGADAQPGAARARPLRAPARRARARARRRRRGRRRRGRGRGGAGGGHDRRRGERRTCADGPAAGRPGAALLRRSVRGRHGPGLSTHSRTNVSP